MELNRHLILAVTFAGALLSSPSAWADGGSQCLHHDGGRHAMSGHRGHGFSGASAHLLRHLLKNKQQLGLTDEQIVTLRTRALDVDRAVIRADADVRISERELRALLRDDQTDLSAVESKVREQEAFKSTARMIGIKARREFIAMLTPDQKTKLKMLWEEHPRLSQGHMTRAAAADATTATGADIGLDAEIELADAERASSAG